MCFSQGKQRYVTNVSSTKAEASENDHCLCQHGPTHGRANRWMAMIEKISRAQCEAFKMGPSLQASICLRCSTTQHYSTATFFFLLLTTTTTSEYITGIQLRRAQHGGVTRLAKQGYSGWGQLGYTWATSSWVSRLPSGGQQSRRVGCLSRTSGYLHC